MTPVERLFVAVGILFLWLLLLSVAFIIHWFKVERVLEQMGKVELGQGKLLRDVLFREAKKKAPAGG